jgi:hypothetical protein
MYIPSPPEELEELPLAPEDSELLAREARLEEERHRLDRILRRDREAPGETTPKRQTSAEPRAASSGISDAVIEYLRALSRSDLAAADQVLPLLQRQKSDVLALLDRLAADQMPPPALGKVPPGVYHGFLKHLRSQL